MACRGQRVAVVGHRRPDGDCIGSQVAMVRVLRALGVEAFAVNESVIPRRVNFLAEGIPFYHGSAWNFTGEKVILVDCSDADRVGPEMAKALPRPQANIDHHLSNKGFAEWDLVDSKASASAQIIAGLLIDCDLPMDPLTAQALWAGIVTDTGNFSYPSTTSEVLQMGAYLVKLGASPSLVAAQIYERENLSRMKLLKVYLDRLLLLAKDRAAIAWLEEKDFEKTGASYEDTEGLVNYGRSLEGVAISAFIERHDGEIKGSLRSSGEQYRMDLLAQRFGGGGHACAAGFTWQGSWEEFLSIFEEEIEKIFEPSESEAP